MGHSPNRVRQALKLPPGEGLACQWLLHGVFRWKTSGKVVLSTDMKAQMRNGTWASLSFLQTKWCARVYHDKGMLSTVFSTAGILLAHHEWQSRDPTSGTTIKLEGR
jgi:hypothetical protein